MTEHTPGPWKAEKGIDTDNWTIWGQRGQLLVAECGPAENTYSEGNAALIAAAPDLLEVLEAIVKDRPTKEPPRDAVRAHANWQFFQRARTAIAKATV